MKKTPIAVISKKRGIDFIFKGLYQGYFQEQLNVYLADQYYISRPIQPDCNAYINGNI
jgi:hypothetical protein